MIRTAGGIFATLIALLGAGLILVAGAGLYDIDHPSRLGLAVIAAMGVSLIGSGAWLMHRMESRS